MYLSLGALGKWLLWCFSPSCSLSISRHGPVNTILRHAFAHLKVAGTTLRNRAAAQAPRPIVERQRLLHCHGALRGAKVDAEESRGVVDVGRDGAGGQRLPVAHPVEAGVGPARVNLGGP